MKNRLAVCLYASLVLVGCNFSQKNNAVFSSEISTDKTLTKNVEHRLWTISGLSDSLANLSTKELLFMDENSMEGTYMELSAGATVKRIARNDDLYYLHAGSCNVELDNQHDRFEAGDVIYVKKGSEIVLKNDDSPMQLVVVSMHLSSDSAKPEWDHFSKELMEATRNPQENMWNSFIMYSNVMLGLYMLPEDVDGDQRLVHEWQELNIVTTGKSKFVMDSGTIDVEEGSIFFVEEGNGHYFDDLESDIDILILWEMRNVDHSNH